MTEAATDVTCPVCDRPPTGSTVICRKCKSSFHVDECGEIPLRVESSDGSLNFVHEYYDYESAFCYSCYPSARINCKRRESRELGARIAQREQLWRKVSVREHETLLDEAKRAETLLWQLKEEVEQVELRQSKIASLQGQASEAWRQADERHHNAVEAWRTAKEAQRTAEEKLQVLRIEQSRIIDSLRAISKEIRQIEAEGKSAAEQRTLAAQQRNSIEEQYQEVLSHLRKAQTKVAETAYQLNAINQRKRSIERDLGIESDSSGESGSK